MTVNKKKKSVNLKKVIAILKALKNENNIEIIHLTLQSILDEIED